MATHCITASSVTYGNDADWSDMSEWQRKANPWTITLTNDAGHSESFHFWTGSALTAEPTVADLIRCLVMDARFLEDEPTEVDYPTGKAIEAQTQKAISLFGRDYWFRLLEMDDDEIDEIF